MYDRVFTPIRIGGVEIPNRIVRTAHATAYSRSYINDDLIAEHEADSDAAKREAHRAIRALRSRRSSRNSRRAPM